MSDDILELEIQSVLGDNTTVVVLKTPLGAFVGDAKRAPGDQRLTEIGEALAGGRALIKYGKFLVQYGHMLSDIKCGKSA